MIQVAFFPLYFIFLVSCTGLYRNAGSESKRKFQLFWTEGLRLMTLFGEPETDKFSNVMASYILDGYFGEEHAEWGTYRKQNNNPVINQQCRSFWGYFKKMRLVLFHIFFDVNKSYETTKTKNMWVNFFQTSLPCLGHSAPSPHIYSFILFFI